MDETWRLEVRGRELVHLQADLVTPTGLVIPSGFVRLPNSAEVEIDHTYDFFRFVADDRYFFSREMCHRELGDVVSCLDLNSSHYGVWIKPSTAILFFDWLGGL